jgi:diadenosine tetraphosphate (Ap4A) HIT family hydrolase
MVHSLAETNLRATNHRATNADVWNDRDRWSALCVGDGCPICRTAEPLDVVAKLEATWVTMQEAAPVRGYACLVSQVHAVELHDLPDAAAAAFMRDAQAVSRAVASATGAVKLNYEIHGNTIPHLHMHVYPRYRGDRFENRPIDPRAVRGPVYAPGEFDRIRAAVRAALRLR